MNLEADTDAESLASLWVILPLALMGFFAASGCLMLFAVSGVHLRTELSLTDFQFGFLLAAPMAVSALIAIPAGLAARKIGARKVMLACLAGLSLCMALLLTVDTYPGFLISASGLGLAGGFYSAGLQFVTRHCKPRRLGIVLGMFGAGMTGAGFTYYLIPLFHQAFSWQGVPLAYLIVLLLVMALLTILTSEDDAGAQPDLPTPFTVLLARLQENQITSLCLYFGMNAGSFFALLLWLPDYLSAQFELPVETGARVAQWFVIPGALAQIVGGGLSDRFGSARVASRCMVVGLLSLVVLSYPPMTVFIRGIDATIQITFALPLITEGIFVIILGIALGCTMGSLQRLAIIHNPTSAALIAGFLLVSAFTVAFFLPMIFSALNHWLEIRSSAFMILFALLATCLALFARNRRAYERKTLLHPEI